MATQPSIQRELTPEQQEQLNQLHEEFDHQCFASMQEHHKRLDAIDKERNKAVAEFYRELAKSEAQS